MKIQNLKTQNILINTHKSLLMEISIRKNEAKLGPNGELVITTGLHTGRAAKDKYVVLNDLSEKKIWWENNIIKMDEKTFEAIENDIIEYYNTTAELYSTERSIGSSEHFALGIEFITTEASSSLFTQYMFKPKLDKNEVKDVFQIYHAPHFKLDFAKYGLRSSTVIVTCFKRKRTLIIGTSYAGEIKKSMFSVMNFLVPDLGILPMHSGANQGKDGETSVFFGLSGTGKTTLSTDEGLHLIGDDEHGLSQKGVFNFEGGCYAKTFKLSSKTEPEIFKASTQFASFLENVVLASDRSLIDFNDGSLTENGRSSYPLESIENRIDSGMGPIPKNIFYLSADAFGVLPPVSLLTADQAMEYFELGYSAKLAGTEVGIKTPEATFSAFFGAPFMLRKPDVYSKILKEIISKNKVKVWLINTGWYGGSYGVGERFPLKITRSIIRSIQTNKLDNTHFVKDEIFNLLVPENIESIDSQVLMPLNAWKNKDDYFITAKKLNDSFKLQLKKIKDSKE